MAIRWRLCAVSHMEQHLGHFSIFWARLRGNDTTVRFHKIEVFAAPRASDKETERGDNGPPRPAYKSAFCG